jgi:hypothetical protein
VSPEEVDAAFHAICDGHKNDTLLRLLREDGEFMGIEVAAPGSAVTSRMPTFRRHPQ